jgi:hypothetical protein
MITQDWKHKSLFLVTICILIVSFMALSLSLVSCAPAKQDTTFESIIITGTANKTSQPFTVTTKEWTADWSYVPLPEYPELATFQFYIFPEGEIAMFVGSMILSNGTSGSLHIDAGAGEYYIRVVADNLKSWKIVISP